VAWRQRRDWADVLALEVELAIPLIELEGALDRVVLPLGHATPSWSVTAATDYHALP
jgi:hypothetical protein